MTTGMRRVAVTGLGAVCAAGVGKQALWQAISDGRSCEAALPELDHLGLKSKIFCPARSLDEAIGQLPQGIREAYDRHVWLGLLAADEAIRQSGLLTDGVDMNRVGVNIGTAIGGTGAMEHGFLQVTEGASHEVQADLMPAHLYRFMCPSSATVAVAATYGCHGPCVTTSTGCTSGQDSIGYGFNAIRSGEADAFIVGAADAPLVPISVAAFDVIGAITRKPVEAAGSASCPFSADRDGFVLGEGAGMAVLEAMDHAEARQAPVLAEIFGFGSTSNAFHMTGLPPDGLDLSRAIAAALQQAALSPEAIDYVNAHGSSTLQNDRNETAAIHHSLGERARRIPVSSIKSIIGHPLGAANSIEFVACVEALNRQFLPPTLNYCRPSQDCDLNYVPRYGRPGRIRTLLSTASGFSGLHAALILGKPAMAEARRS